MSVNVTELIVGIIGILVTSLFIPMAVSFIQKTRASLTNAQIATMDYWTSKLCTVAEIIFDGISQGANKKEWVIQQLLDQKVIKEPDIEYISNLIDAICVELTNSGLINLSNTNEPNEDQGQPILEA